MELQRVIFTQDQDFLIEANRRQIERIPFFGVIYGHRRVVTIGDCIRDLEILAKVSDPEDLANSVQYLPLYKNSEIQDFLIIRVQSIIFL